MSAPVRYLRAALLAALLVVLARPVEAATGDYLFSWGNEYHFSEPKDLALDAQGNVYVADTYFHQVKVYSSTGKLLRKWGSPGAADGQFNNPYAIEVDAAGQVFVSDLSNCRIQVFDAEGRFLRKFGECGSGAGQIDGAYGMALDPQGNVYLMEYPNGRVQVFSNDGAFLRQWPNLGGPQGSIAVDSSGRVYVTNQWGYRVAVYSGDGTLLRYVGTYGTGPGRFQWQTGIAFDAADNVYLTDYQTNTVQVFDATGAFLRQWGGFGRGPGQFYMPRGLAIGADGRVYVCDTRNNRIHILDPYGTYLESWENFSAVAGLFSNVGGAAVSAQGEVFVADTGNHRIQVFDNDGGYLWQFGTYGSGNGQLAYPSDLALDEAGNVYVMDTGNGRVQVFDQSGAYLRSWGRLTGPFGSTSSIYKNAQGIDVKNGRVYVADTDNHQISVHDLLGGFVTRFGGFGWWSDTQMLWPRDVAADAAGVIYVADTQRYLVQSFSPSGQFLRKWGLPGGFLTPNSVTVNAAGQLYVTDTAFGTGNRVVVYDGCGYQFADWHMPDRPDEEFGSVGRIGVAVDGTTYVTDAGVNRIHVFDGHVAMPTVVADAGADVTAEQESPAGATVTLDASASVPGSACTSYRWTWANGSAEGAAPTVLFPPGTTQVTLVVRYGAVQATDTLLVTIRDPQPPETTVAVHGTPGDNGWFVSPVRLEFTSYDAVPGVREILVSVDGGPEVLYPGTSASVVLGADGVHTVTYRGVDLAGGSEIAKSLEARIDTASPVIAITGVADGAVYTFGSVPVPGFDVTDALSGVASSSSSLAGGNSLGAGTFTFSVQAKDVAGNLAAASVSYRVAYDFGTGFGSPLDQDRPFKLGSTIPVKFSLRDAAGMPVTGAAATIGLVLYSGEVPAGDPIDGVSAGNADAGNAFRYDPEGGQYIFNLSTKSLTIGTWKVIVAVDDGTIMSAFISLKSH
ncbi:MAG TPA: 6-bladed beta-propeller [Candidatus Methanoperedens sp.]|nr:6-bladed beta-propeller [Candidatus Methanoperedens sp.]